MADLLFHFSSDNPLNCLDLPVLTLGKRLWRILKDKLLRPIDYAMTNNLFYAENSALADARDLLKVYYYKTKFVLLLILSSL